jgi:hypothetical protein
MQSKNHYNIFLKNCDKSFFYKVENRLHLYRDLISIPVIQTFTVYLLYINIDFKYLLLNNKILIKFISIFRGRNGVAIVWYSYIYIYIYMLYQCNQSLQKYLVFIFPFKSHAFCQWNQYYLLECYRGRRGRDCMVVGFTTTYAISAYHHKRCEFESVVVVIVW